MELEDEISSQLLQAPASYAKLLRRCGDSRALEQGRRVHSHILSSCRGKGTSLFLSNLLVQMYAKCGSLDEARNIFTSIPDRNVYSWTLLMNGYAQNGHPRLALELYWSMSNQGIRTDNTVVFLIALGACSKLEDLSSGKSVHSHVVESGLFCESLHSALINMYGRCRSCSDAKREFDRVATRNVVAWSAMVAAYARNGHYTEALGLYERMVAEGLQPNQVTYISVVEACARSGSLEKCREVHDRIVREDFDVDTTLGNAMINMYSKCGSSTDAWKVFSSLCERNVFSWNCMISAFTQQGEDERALQLYRQMEPEGVKGNAVTYVSALSACSARRDLGEGRRIHDRVAGAGYSSQVPVRNALLSMYSKCGELKVARKIFDETVDRTIVSWNAMIAAYAQNGHASEALRLYERMDVRADCITFTTALDACSRLGDINQGKATHQRLVSAGFKADTATGNALVTMYARCGSLEQARDVFDGMESKDVVTWSAMITAYSQNGQGEDALRVYQGMKALSSVKPNDITLISVVDACCIAKDITEGRLVHRRISSRRLKLAGPLGNALVNMYTNCGSLSEARDVFERMEERDVICWSSIIAAYAQHGHGPEALKLLQELCVEGVEPDSITLITILFACSHAGLVAEGRYVFLLLSFDYSCSPDVQHFECLVDLLARAGWLAEAEELVATMPFEPDYAAYMSLLGSYNSSGEYQKGRKAAETAFSHGLLDHRKNR